MWGTDDGVGTGRLVDDDLRSPHIDELDISKMVYHNVFWFQIAVHYFMEMEVFDC